MQNQLFAHNTQQKDAQEIDIDGDQPQTVSNLVKVQSSKRFHQC